MPLGNVPGMIASAIGGSTGAAAMLTVYDCVEELVPFLTITVKVELPDAVGIPEIIVVVPVAAVFNVMPAGKLPEEILQVNGPVAVVEAVNI